MFNRFNGNVEPFASNSTGTNRTVFGDTVQSDDIDDNLNTDFKLGWEIVGVNDNPTKQDFNALAFTISNLLSYLYQQGVAEWNTTQEYFENSYCVGSDGKLYRAKTGTSGTPNIGNNPTTDSVNWDGLDADLLDGLTSSQFLRSDASDHMSGQLSGAVGAMATAGTLDWNDVTNARGGSGFTLLLGSESNGPGGSSYYHTFGFELGVNKNGTGNLTQFAIPYGNVANTTIKFRTKFSSVWSSWIELIDLATATTEAKTFDIGINQTWQNVTVSRAFGVTYTNTTGKPIMIAIGTTFTSSSSNLQPTVNGVVLLNSYLSGANGGNSATFIVPPGNTYSATSVGTTLGYWVELR